MTSFDIMKFDNNVYVNGLKAEGAKPLPEPKFTSHKKAFLQHISQPFLPHASEEESFQYKVFKMSPGPNELILGHHMWKHGGKI